MSKNEVLIDVDSISRVLAVLIAENDQYSYVDKLGYVVSPDLAVYYLREALRDFTSLMSKSEREWNLKTAFREARGIPMHKVDNAIEKLATIDDPKEIRKLVSLIAAKALAKANKLKLLDTMKKSEEKEGEK